MTTLGSPIQTPANALTAWHFFTGNGYSAAQAAGIVGNLWWESGSVDPTSVNPNGPHTGIAQWDTNRWQNFLNYCNQYGLPPMSLTSQLQFVLLELNTDYTNANAALKQTTTPAAAASVMFNDYEIAGDGTLPNRIAYADDVYNAATGKSVPPGSDQAAQTTGGNNNSQGQTNCLYKAGNICNCQIGWTWPSVGFLGGGNVCLWYANWSRALLGGACLVGAGVLALGAVAILSKNKAIVLTPLGPARGIATSAGATSVRYARRAFPYMGQ